MMVLKFISYLKNASHLSFVCWQSAVTLLTMVNALEMQPGMTVNSLRNGAPAPGIQMILSKSDCKISAFLRKKYEQKLQGRYSLMKQDVT